MKYECKSNNSPNKKHKWEFHTTATWTANGPKPAYLICKYCQDLITALEFEEIQNQTKTIRILIITTIIAFLGLIVSLISLFCK